MSGVVHVITALERGGAQRNTLETAARLHRDDRPQWLIAGRPAALDEEARERLGRRFLSLPSLVGPIRPLDDGAALFSLHRALSALRDRLGRPLVVHTHSSKAGVLGRLAARALEGARVVHTVHGFGFEALGPRRRSLLLAMERLAAPATHRLVFVSTHDIELAERLRLGVRVPRALIRSGIDPRLAARACDADRRVRARRALGVPPDAVVALTVANMKPQKDPLFHVEVLAAWRARRPEAQLVFVGDGPLRSAMEERARVLGVRQALHLPGFVESTIDALAAADVFLLASRWEGLPRSVLEALVAGLPVVVRDAGWARDLSFTSRLIARPLEAPASELAAALQTAVAWGRQSVVLPEAFTLDGMLSALDRLYDELLQA